MRNFAPLLLLALAACDTAAMQETKNSASPSAAPTTQESTTPAATASTTPAESSPESTPKLPLPSPAEVSALAKSNNAFALDLFAKLRETKGNFAMSPASIAMALTMTWGGAKGETSAQMKKVLHREGTADQAMSATGKLIASYADPQKKFTLRIANRLFGEKTYSFEKPYLDKTLAAFGAPLEQVDFTKTESARADVNAWVAKETHDRIKDLLPPGSVTPDTRLILANAIYFLADWQVPFKPEATAPAAFHVTGSEAHDVPTMYSTASFPIAAGDGVKVLEMPYQGGDVAMDFILPDQVDGLDAVEQRLDGETLTKWVAAMSVKRVNVALPKLTIDPATPTALSHALGELGMPLAFEPGKADFSAIADPPKAADRLYISQVFHKAFLKIDEKGTEAAAATAVVMSRAGAAMPTEPPQEFKANHPFLFVLRDVRSGMILFMGRVSDPIAK